MISKTFVTSRTRRVLADIAFGEQSDTSPLLVFENVRLENSLGLDLRLNGKYNPLVPSIVFNFKIRGVGPICRVEINGTMHKGSRTHKHSLQNEDDPRQNLPYAGHRPDLEGKTARGVWEVLCSQARIEHEGMFADPQRRRL